EAVPLLAFGPGLVRDQHPAQHLGRARLDLVDGFYDADAALGVGAQPLEPALAAAAGVDLRLHHEHRPAELLRSLDGFVHREGGIAARDGDAELLDTGLG